jgi:phospholipase/carboxylesterase
MALQCAAVAFTRPLTPADGQILDIIAQLMGEGIAPNRIFVGGFSMGGGMALQFLARFKRPLAGVFAMSSFLATDSRV